jgi:hypothetical protein
MKAVINSNFNTSFEKAVKGVGTSRLLEFIASPILSFKPVEVESFPENWKDDDKFKSKMKFLRFLPLGQQLIT